MLSWHVAHEIEYLLQHEIEMGSEHQGNVIRFSGYDEAKYQGWKRWAKAKIHRLRR